MRAWQGWVALGLLVVGTLGVELSAAVAHEDKRALHVALLAAFALTVALTYGRDPEA